MIENSVRNVLNYTTSLDSSNLENFILMRRWILSLATVCARLLLTSSTAAGMVGVVTGRTPMSAGELGLGMMWTDPLWRNTYAGDTYTICQPRTLTFIQCCTNDTISNFIYICHTEACLKVHFSPSSINTRSFLLFVWYEDLVRCHFM